MKKTYNINISGYGFVIDEDAYEMLQSYLSTLGQICEKAGEKETATDIEQRIAEIFMENFNTGGTRIITLSDVEQVIGRMGAPEEIVDVEVEAGPESFRESVGGTSEPPVPPIPNIPIRKRLYRDLDDRVLGGVCSGIGWYFGIDPVWIRVIAVAGAFLSASTLVILYLLLWIIVPPARTPYERMQMMGVNPSMQNVGRVVKGEYSGRRDVASGIGRIFMVICVGFCLIVTGALLIAAAASFLGCLVALLVLSVSPHYTDISVTHTQLVLGVIVGAAMIIGLPLFLLFRALIGILTGRTPAPFTLAQNIVLISAWILGLGAVITCACLL